MKRSDRWLALLVVAATPRCGLAQDILSSTTVTAYTLDPRHLSQFNNFIARYLTGNVVAAPGWKIDCGGKPVGIFIDPAYSTAAHLVYSYPGVTCTLSNSTGTAIPVTAPLPSASERILIMRRVGYGGSTSSPILLKPSDGIAKLNLVFEYNKAPCPTNYTGVGWEPRMPGMESGVPALYPWWQPAPPPETSTWVTWSITPIGVAKLSASSGWFADLTPQANGNATLTATYTVPGSAKMTVSSTVGISGFTSWVNATFSASDVAVGANGSVWYIGADRSSIYRMDATGPTQIPGGASRIAVDPAGLAWVVNGAGEIFRWTGSTWQPMPGEATDIGIGANGAVFIITAGGGGQPMRWTGSSWSGIGGGGQWISVDPSGNPWTVNTAGQIWQWANGNWVLRPGAASDIGVGADGSVYIAASDGTIQKWNGTSWVPTGASGNRVAAGPAGVAYAARNGQPAIKAPDAPY